MTISASRHGPAEVRIQLASLQEVGYAQKSFNGIYRFRQEILRPTHQGTIACLGRDVTRQHQHGQVVTGGERADLVQHSETGDVGHVQIEHHEIRIVFDEPLRNAARVGFDIHTIDALMDQELLQELHGPHVIVDDEYAHAAKALEESCHFSLPAWP